MRLDQRLEALEKRLFETDASSDERAKLLEAIETTAARVRGGDLSDRDNASVIERVAMAFERGDQAFAEELLLNAVERVPA